MNSQNILELVNKSFHINNKTFTDEFNNRFLLEEYNDIKDDIIKDEETFYIYVTGITDGGSLIQNKSINIPNYDHIASKKFWLDGGIRNHILPLIPDRFKKIKIRYYDPIGTIKYSPYFFLKTKLFKVYEEHIAKFDYDSKLIKLEDNYRDNFSEYEKKKEELEKEFIDFVNIDYWNKEKESDEELKKYMNIYLDYLQKNLIDEDNKNPRINSKFYKEYFPTQIISKTKEKSYFVIDFAHIFNKSTRKDYVYFKYSHNPLEEDRNTEFKLITIYPNYLTDLTDFSALIKINDDNTVVII